MEFSQFKRPFDIQLFLNTTRYKPEDGCFSPKKVFETKRCHCFDGAVFAAAALEHLGFPPLIVDLVAENDDDHVIAVFKTEGWGAVAKSNTTTLRFREPIYRSIRELVMSYFDVYYNLKKVKSLRTYSKPINLNRFNKFNWRACDKDLDIIEEYFAKVKHYPVLTEKMKAALSLVDDDLYAAGLLGSDPEGLFKPE